MTYAQTKKMSYNGFKWLIMGFIGGILLIGGCDMLAHAGVNIDMAKIAYIESSNNPRAFNKRSGAVGLCQVTKYVLIDYNKRWKTNWKMRDLYNADLNMLVADWYMNSDIPRLLRHYNIKDTIANRLRAYNSGIGILRRGVLPLETRNYIKKYMKG